MPYLMVLSPLRKLMPPQRRHFVAAAAALFFALCFAFVGRQNALAQSPSGTPPSSAGVPNQSKPADGGAPTEATTPAGAAADAAAPVSAKDVAGGYAVGTAGDAADAGGTALDPAKFSGNELELANRVGQNRVAINFTWMLICGFLVMFMQAGFAMVETGFCRAKHAAHVIMTNFLIYPIGMLGFFVCGFAFMFGSAGGYAQIGLGGDYLNAGNQFIGWKGFFLSNAVYHPAVYGLFLFQMVFMDTTCTIPTGAMAERWKFSAFIIYGFFISMFIYPIYGHWVWGLGWLANLGQTDATKAFLALGWGHGAVDFAGSGVVHAVGGWVALAGAMVLGPRIGKYAEDAQGNIIKPFRPRALQGHHIPMALIGTFILAFGWFGFNAGSTLGASGGGNLRIAVIATNTMLASAGGAIAALLYWSKKYGYPDPSMCANGFLAGLVGITAPCAFTNAGWSIVIGIVAGILVCIAVPFVEKRGVDDPVGAFSVHGVCGVWGLLAVGIFSDGTYGKGWNFITTDYATNNGVTGILYGNTGQFLAQLLNSIVVVAWAFGMGYLFFKVQSAVQGIRSRREDEIQGLDMPEMGAVAYPEFEQVSSAVGTGR